ncbi:MAG: hypothetical protein H7146_14275, partial [Burkholderiaceae bacterium]|nr:hypothetical protein [Microbacteriaceae bacterium]
MIRPRAPEPGSARAVSRWRPAVAVGGVLAAAVGVVAVGGVWLGSATSADNGPAAVFSGRHDIVRLSRDTLTTTYLTTMPAATRSGAFRAAQGVELATVTVPAGLYAVAWSLDADYTVALLPVGSVSCTIIDRDTGSPVGPATAEPVPADAGWMSREAHTVVGVPDSTISLSCIPGVSGLATLATRRVSLSATTIGSGALHSVTARSGTAGENTAGENTTGDGTSADSTVTDSTVGDST